MEAQQVNEEFDAAQAGYLARRETGRSTTCRMRKRAAAWACRPGELSGQLRDTSPRPDAGLPPRDPIGVAALWDTVGQLADEPQPPESFPAGSPDRSRRPPAVASGITSPVGGNVL